MNLIKKKLYSTFFISLILALVLPSFFSSMRLLFFAPFLIVLYYQKPYLNCLWGALLCGLIVDLLSSGTHFGLHALNYLSTSILLYKYRLHFFGDNCSTIGIMTFLFACISTIIQWILVYIFDAGAPFSLRFFLTEIVVMPLYDSAYAYLVFIFPFWALEYGSRMWAAFGHGSKRGRWQDDKMAR
jgi:rod shape-determining protein MreD